MKVDAQTLEIAALCFATAAHAGQVRKYTGAPYIEHPMAVANIMAAASVHRFPEMKAAALLHDVVEDTAVSQADVYSMFGPYVADLVDWLTDQSKPEDGNRAIRKAIDRARLAGAPTAAKTIKLADLIDNARDITAHDPGFAKVYLGEMRLLLDVLKEGDATLHAMASEIVGRAA